MLTQCCPHVGPASTTLAQHKDSIVLAWRVCWTICLITHTNTIVIQTGSGATSSDPDQIPTCATDCLIISLGSAAASRGWHRSGRPTRSGSSVPQTTIPVRQCPADQPWFHPAEQRMDCKCKPGSQGPPGMSVLLPQSIYFCYKIV